MTTKVKVNLNVLPLYRQQTVADIACVGRDVSTSPSLRHQSTTTQYHPHQTTYHSATDSDQHSQHYTSVNSMCYRIYGLLTVLVYLQAYALGTNWFSFQNQTFRIYKLKLTLTIYVVQ